MVYARQDSSTILGTLDKGLHVLIVLASAPKDGLTLSELAEQVGIHRTTLFRILNTLQARGFVDRIEDTSRYQLGLGVLQLAASVLRDLNIREIARPILHALCVRVEEVVYLTILDQDEVVTVESWDSNQVISLRMMVGDRRPAYCTASGKAMLAYLPEAEVGRILERGMPSLTPRTITTPVVMVHHLASIREQGFAYDDEERMEGLRCVAAPIFNVEGTVIAAASIAMPAMRAPWPRLMDLGRDAATAAGAVSRQLGYRAAPAAPLAAEPETLSPTNQVV